MTDDVPATIYALVDPRDDSVRYVGRTTSPLSARLGVHVYWCRSGRVKGPRGKWIKDLLSAGQRPRIVPLERCSASVMADRERHHIGEMRRQGHPLTNTRGG